MTKGSEVSRSLVFRLCMYALSCDKQLMELNQLCGWIVTLFSKLLRHADATVLHIWVVWTEDLDIVNQSYLEFLARPASLLVRACWAFRVDIILYIL